MTCMSARLGSCLENPVNPEVSSSQTRCPSAFCAVRLDSEACEATTIVSGQDGSFGFLVLA